ncbi:hypothetical protein N6L24_07780 [Cognatishimia sp. SS12]|uniref:hypothetical protein n=1 Tax=Cognatishimia sp. SS12 TaxID=2979465 RepID=UPI00232BA1F0|nr:hypothetical protein [Cognatishimia sp. SS12]MDC0738175.1 hypothetical protein [Cognatishimia sp. SS12]
MKRHWIWAVAGYAALLGGGYFLGQILSSWIAVPGPGGEIYSPMVLSVAALFVLTSAMPFVPGAEIGFALMMVFGSRIALLVYLCMLAALWIAFFAGYLLPRSAIQNLFLALGLKRAAVLVQRTEDMDIAARHEFLSTHAKGRILPLLLRNRYLTLVLALNVPGNAVLGGGGGLSLLAGLSRLYSPLGFCLATAVAVAPVPILVRLLSYAP